MQQGEVFAGRYLIEQTLGAGGMGVVYRVLDQRLHRQAALKVMNPDLSHDPTFRQRFEREAKAGAGFEHPNVVTVHHYDEHDGTLYLVTQYVPGRNLHRVLDEAGPLSIERTVDVVRQLAAGLDAAHRHGQVHRDVKPANVLLGQDEHGHDHVLLSDFGLAQVLDSGDDRLTSTGTMLGTATYGSPEQFRGEAATVRSDVYSLACVTFEMLTGRPPFRGATDVETAGHHLSQQPPDLESFGLAPSVSAVVERGLSKNPYDRQVSAGAFAQELAVTQNDAPKTQVINVPKVTGELPVVPARRNLRVLAIAAAVVAVAFAAGLAGGLLNGPGGGTPRSTTTPTGDAHLALTALLPSAVYQNCTPQPEREGPGRPASVRCTTPLPGVDELLVTKWDSAASMAADFTTTYGAKTDGKCGSYTGDPRSGLRSTWGNNNQALACYLNNNGAAIILWEYPDKAVAVFAVRTDGNAQAAFTWWQTAVNTPLT